MAYIPYVHISYPYHHSSMINRNNIDDKKKTKDINENRKIEKSVPDKCMRCECYTSGHCLDVKNGISRKIDTIPSKKIEECNFMHDLITDREKWKKCDWTYINKELFKINLAFYDGESESKFILKNFKLAIEFFKPWEILTYLHYEKEFFYHFKENNLFDLKWNRSIYNIFYRLISHDDYDLTRSCYKYDKFQEFLKTKKDCDILEESDIENSKLIKYDYDMLTIILIKNLLLINEKDEISNIIFDLLDNIKDTDDFLEIINLLHEYRMFDYEDDSKKIKIVKW